MITNFSSPVNPFVSNFALIFLSRSAIFAKSAGAEQCRDGSNDYTEPRV
jgi:hypothetical protein